MPRLHGPPSHPRISRNTEQRLNQKSKIDRRGMLHNAPAVVLDAALNPALLDHATSAVSCERRQLASSMNSSPPRAGGGRRLRCAAQNAITARISCGPAIMPCFLPGTL